MNHLRIIHENNVFVQQSNLLQVLRSESVHGFEQLVQILRHRPPKLIDDIFHQIIKKRQANRER